MASSAAAAEHNRPQPMSFEDHQRMTQATQVARMQRRSMPPRCNPFAILLIVVSVGMMFIGVTMTIISHWPGATQIGEDPLKITGPVLFGVGGLLVIFCIFLIYFLNMRERRRWDANLAKLVNTKLASARDSQLSSDADKSAATGPAYYSNVDSSDEPPPRRSQPGGERGIDLLPDPSRSNGYAGSGGGGDSDAGSVPQPLRVPKKRRSQPPRGDASASDASVGSADLAPGMTSTLRQDPTAVGPPAYANVSYDRDTPQEERRTKPPKQPGGDKEGKRRRPRGPPAADPIRDPVMRNVAAQQQQLRVHIKAQPGTAVHITPSSTPPTTRPGGVDEAPAYHARPVAAAGYQPQEVRAFSSGAESETEI